LVSLGRKIRLFQRPNSAHRSGFHVLFSLVLVRLYHRSGKIDGFSYIVQRKIAPDEADLYY